ncbi:ankyrin repeat domain-containing protein [Hydrogenophilus thermoluteolus]|uniref:ankyrin repeat domain-containing protein n=1 Tax=Hydrogenophilus thermoluteolus TaxID=297 RepID=UPI003F670DE3
MRRWVTRIAMGLLFCAITPALQALSNEEKALFDAAQLGDAGAVKRLLAAGVSAKTQGAFGVTPLMYAAESGDLETVKILLDAGADLHARCTVGRTALFMRSNRGVSKPLRFSSKRARK